jgi:PAS domain S-box-containing protein
MAGVSGGELVHLFVDELTDYAVIAIDGTDKIVAWNAGARALLGYTADEAVGGSFSQLYSKIDPAASESMASILDAAHIGRHETNRQLVRRNGVRFQANIVLRPILDASLAIVGFGLIVHDIDRSRRIATAVPALPAQSRGTARILVVDDNQGVLGIATDQLSSLGYHVISASSGAEAIEMLREDDQVDLLFTDVVMPGELAGRALAARAMEMRPGLKVLFCSGYFEGTLVGKGELETDVQFLPKPYRKQELARKIEEVLGTAL